MLALGLRYGLAGLIVGTALLSLSGLALMVARGRSLRTLRAIVTNVLIERRLPSLARDGDEGAAIPDEASTIHRKLRPVRGSMTRFHHDAEQPDHRQRLGDRRRPEVALGGDHGQLVAMVKSDAHRRSLPRASCADACNELYEHNPYLSTKKSKMCPRALLSARNSSVY